ncbi:MAG: hypothetical protein M3Z32_05765, partial [Acidobacteriota bacterium]|nr:hypothetical protein [Acidobacteriota bacterium]
SAAGSAAVRSGNTLALTLAVTLNNAVVGSQQLFAYAHDAGNQASGWQTLGTWTPGAAANAPPTADSVTPNASTGASQNLTFRYSSSAGYSNLGVLYALINSTQAGAYSCLIEYVPASNALYLFNDPATGVVGQLTPGGGGSLSNSRCTVSAAGSAAVRSGNTLALTLAVTLNNAVVGSQQLFAYAHDAGNQASGWQTLGTWTP